MSTKIQGEMVFPPLPHFGQKGFLSEGGWVVYFEALVAGSFLFVVSTPPPGT